jgi:hypothetical protein
MTKTYALKTIYESMVHTTSKPVTRQVMMSPAKCTKAKIVFDLLDPTNQQAAKSVRLPVCSPNNWIQ